MKLTYGIAAGRAKSIANPIRTMANVTANLGINCGLKVDKFYVRVKNFNTL